MADSLNDRWLAMMLPSPMTLPNLAMNGESFHRTSICSVKCLLLNLMMDVLTLVVSAVVVVWMDLLLLVKRKQKQRVGVIRG